MMIRLSTGPGWAGEGELRASWVRKSSSKTVGAVIFRMEDAMKS